MPDRRSILIALGATPALLLPPKLRATAPAPDLGAVDAHITREVGSGRIPAVAAMLATGGKVIWERANGWADRERGLRATLATPFSLASVTKPFTAATLMTLVADGRLGLDEPAAAYLGSGVIGEIDGAPPMTVRQLGAHLSGLPSLFAMYPVGNAVRAPSEREALREWAHAAYPPLATYEYSNIGYLALGQAAEQVSGRPFDQLIASRLLRPLGLRDSFFIGEPRDWSRAARRYDEQGRAIPFYVTATPPSGELFASARDVMKFALFNLNAFRGAGQPLARTLIDELHRPVAFGPHGGVSFGWFTGTAASGLPVIFKDGGQPGVSTVVYLVPSLDAACVVLTNRSDPDGWAQDLADRIMACVVPGWTTPDTSMRSPAEPLSASAALERWTGEFARGRDRVPIAVDFGAGTLSIGAGAPQALVAVRREGDFLTAKSSGDIPLPVVDRNGARDIRIKLMNAGDRLEGRLLALAERPGWLATIPATVSLRRQG